MVLAFIGRSKRGGGDSPARAEAIVEGEAGGKEESAGAVEPDLDRLARDVYAILKQRLAWEKERSLAIR